jgi:hypothetical protein
MVLCILSFELFKINIVYLQSFLNLMTPMTKVDIRYFYDVILSVLAVVIPLSLKLYLLFSCSSFINLNSSYLKNFINGEKDI